MTSVQASQQAIARKRLKVRFRGHVSTVFIIRRYVKVETVESISGRSTTLLEYCDQIMCERSSLCGWAGNEKVVDDFCSERFYTVPVSSIQKKLLNIVNVLELICIMQIIFDDTQPLASGYNYTISKV